MPHPEQHFRWTWNLASPPEALNPLALKAGIHCGPCLAINQNERLDWKKAIGLTFMPRRVA